jgi:REP element-mobilizing transposase RayT
MSYRDLAKGRFSSENQIYFITTVINKRRKLFVNLEPCRNIIQQMKRLDDEGHIATIAWVMPDHIHWLFELKTDYDLATVVKRFKGRTARKLNLLLGKKGTFWQHAYYDHALRTDEDIKKIARYIVANPLRAGLVERIEDYPHWDAVWL